MISWPSQNSIEKDDPLMQGPVKMLTLWSKVTFIFGAWSPAETKVLPILWFSTPYKSKVTTILWNVDPLMQGHICFWCLIPSRSKVLVIL